MISLLDDRMKYFHTFYFSVFATAAAAAKIASVMIIKFGSVTIALRDCYKALLI